MTRRPLDLITGEWLDFPSAEERQHTRLARMRHLVWLAIGTMARMEQEDGTRLVMYTLTYKGLSDWEPRHVSGFCRWLRRTGHTGYTWVGELQKRGAVHYHVLASLPKGIQWTKPTGGHGWARGFTWVSDGIRKPFYIMKYLQKGATNGPAIRFPSGFRLYAISQSVVRRMDFEHSVAYRQSQIPRWARDASCDGRISRCMFRVSLGVSFGGLTAYSPYTTHGLASVDKVTDGMYDRFLNSPIAPPSYS